MAKYLINDSTLQDIADAIREKRGHTYALPVSGFATEIANISTGGKPWFYDVPDDRWYDNSDGSYGDPPDYDNMACPYCGARLQASYDIDANPCDTNCPVCSGAITLIDGNVNERENIESGVYYFDVLDQMWVDNSGDAPWGTPDYPDMSCPHCGVTLQANNDIDGNPQDTECPNCGGAIRLLDGQVIDREGGNSASVQTCTLYAYGSCGLLGATVLDDTGVHFVSYESLSGITVIENVVCGTLFEVETYVAGTPTGVGCSRHSGACYLVGSGVTTASVTLISDEPM